jgi:two-component system chemotaxis response regulator CheB
MEGIKNKIRVLVVDDSAVMRKMIPSLLSRDDEIEVVATAIDGDFALGKIEQLKPDVVTLDVDMPRMDGITTLGLIVSKYRVPVLMLSSLTTRDAALTLKALEMGAVDFICKPRGAGRVGEMAAELISKVKGAARSRLVSAPELPALPRTKKRAEMPTRIAGADTIVAIGASSGGPNALRHVLPRIPAGFKASIVIVQHMPESFTAVMARWLDDICEIDVREARDGDLIVPGTALIAPGNAHLRVKRTVLGGVVELDKGTPVNGHMPSVDVLFRSVAREYGRQAAGIIMTGMGSDGADGLGEIKKAGGFTLAQDRESCAIYGMPRVAIERGNAQAIAPLNEIAAWMTAIAGPTKNSEVFQDGRHNRA